MTIAEDGMLPIEADTISFLLDSVFWLFSFRISHNVWVSVKTVIGLMRPYVLTQCLNLMVYLPFCTFVLLLLLHFCADDAPTHFILLACQY